ncbi:MAG: carbohydrate ABC transporter permease, partial [Lachnospiraceae bacterium]
MKERKVTSILFSIFKYASLILASIVSLTPVCVCILTAFKTNEEYASTSVLDAPASFLNFENFKIAFQQANMLRSFMNTGIILIVVLTVSVFTGSMLAYVLNRFKFKGCGIIQSLFLFASLLPGIAMQVTIYQIMYALGFINHLYGYMVVLMGTDIISIYIFLQFFENLP